MYIATCWHHLLVSLCGNQNRLPFLAISLANDQWEKWRRIRYVESQVMNRFLGASTGVTNSGDNLMPNRTVMFNRYADLQHLQ